MDLYKITSPRFLIISLPVILFMGCTDMETAITDRKDNPMKLWYDRPAGVWEEALPIGNGRLGAMVYGGTVTETVQLNEETIWAGEPGNNILPGIRESLPEIRRLIFEGKNAEAQELAYRYLPRFAGEIVVGSGQSGKILLL